MQCRAHALADRGAPRARDDVTHRCGHAFRCRADVHRSRADAVRGGVLQQLYSTLTGGRVDGARASRTRRGAMAASRTQHHKCKPA